MKSPEKAENMDVDDEDEDDDYFNPKIYFICKLCRQIFPSVKELLSHKRSQHSKNELKGIQSIIFEERFAKTNSRDTAELIVDQNEELQSCENNDSSCSETQKVTLPSPYVRVTRLTSEEINLFLNRRSCPIKTDVSDENVIIQNKTKKIEIPDCAINVLKCDAANKNMSTAAIQTVDANQGPGDSSLRKRAVSIDLTENEISELVEDDEVVDLCGPYVRLEKLTAKQIESKLKSRSTVKPDIPDLGGEDSAGSPSSTTSEPNTIISPFNGTEERVASSSQNLETFSEVLNKEKHRFTTTKTDQNMYNETPNISPNAFLLSSTSLSTPSNSVPRNPNPRNVSNCSYAHKVSGGKYVIKSLIKNSVDDTVKVAFRTAHILPNVPTKLSTKSACSSLNNSNLSAPGRETEYESVQNEQNIEGPIHHLLESPTRSNTLTNTASKTNNSEAQMCSGCGQVFHAVVEVEDHEKKCRFLPRNRNKKLHLKNNSVVTLRDPLKPLRGKAQDNVVQAEQTQDVQVVYQKVKENSTKEKNIPHPIAGNSRSNKADPEPSIEKLIDCHNEIRYNDGTLNVILFSRDPTSTGSTSQINTENPRICKLCSTKLVTEEEFQNHCENCYLHNKDRHIHCISCNKNFENPQQLNFHLMNIHFTPENLPGKSWNSSGSRVPEVENFENNLHEGDGLPLAEWLGKRKQNFPDLILLDPDPTQPKFQLSCSTMKFEIKCKLCNVSLKSEISVKRHVSVCWTYNKNQHCFCVRCKTGGWKPDILVKHRLLTHSGKLLPLPPFFCIECKRECQTHSELYLHEKSLKRFCENMRMAVYRNKSSFGTSSPTTTTVNGTRDISTLPLTGSVDDHNHSDNNYLIYPATNIFEEPEAWTETQSKIRNPNIQTVSSTKESRIGAGNTIGTTSGRNNSEVGVDELNQTSSLVPQKFSCIKCRQFFNSAFALKCHDDPQYMNSTIFTIQECVNQQKKQLRGQSQSSKSCEPKTTLEGVKVKSTHNVIAEGEKTSEILTAEKDDDDVQIIDAVESLPMQEEKDGERQEETLEPQHEAGSTMSLANWFKFQSDRECSDPDGPVNVIVLDPDPTSTVHAKPFKISAENPVTCKLCQTNLETEPDVKNHAENCWLHNKDRHIFCITCEMPFKHPMQLKEHYKSRHSDSDSDTETASNNKGTENAGDIEVANENELELDLDDDDDLDLLPLGEWIQKRRKMFPDIILVDPDPDPTSSYDLSLRRSVRHTTRSSASALLMCQLCRFKCNSENEIKCHLQICWTYNKSNHCYCIPCEIHFSSVLNLEIHQRVSHEQNASLRCCRDCHQGFKWDLDLKKHEDSTQEFFHRMKLDQEKKNMKRRVSSLLSSSGSISAGDAVANTSTNSNSNNLAEYLNSSRITHQDTSEGPVPVPVPVPVSVPVPVIKSKKCCIICDKSFLSQKSLEKHTIMSHAQVQGKTGVNAQDRKKQQVGIHFQCNEKGCKRNYKHYHFAQQEDVQLLKLANIEEGNIREDVAEVEVRKSNTNTPTGAIENNEEAMEMEQGERYATATSADQSVISSEEDPPRKVPKFDTVNGFAELGTRVTKDMLAQAKSKD